MGNNFFIPLEADVTPWTALAFNAPMTTLDRMGTYNRPTIIFCEGRVDYNQDTEKLTWTDTIHIYFNDSEGLARHNWITAGNVTLQDDKIAYAGLNESDTAVSMQVALVTPDSASNFLAYDVALLGYVFADNHKFIPVGLTSVMLSQGDGVQVLTCATTLDIDWVHEKSAYLLMDQDVDTLTFSGMLDGKTYALETKQDAGTPYDISFPGSIVWENNTAPILNQTLGEVELFEFHKSSTAIYGRLVRTSANYHDLQFSVSGGVIPVGANFPSFETFTTNTKEYAFAVDDFIDIDANELTHSWVEGTIGHVHLHLTTNDAVVASEYAKFTVYLAYQQVSGIWTETSFTAETPDLNGLADLGGFDLDMGDLDLSGLTTETRIKPRIKRIAATSGDEYGEDIFVNQLGIHTLSDFNGSRSEYTK